MCHSNFQEFNDFLNSKAELSTLLKRIEPESLWTRNIENRELLIYSEEYSISNVFDWAPLSHRDRDRDRDRDLTSVQRPEMIKTNSFGIVTGRSRSRSRSWTVTVW